MSILCGRPFWFLSKISDGRNCKFVRLLALQSDGQVNAVKPVSYSLLLRYIVSFTDVKLASAATTQDYRWRPLVYSCFSSLLC
jgi:hypothetical protein